MTSQTASSNLGLHGRMSELHSVLHNALFLTPHHPKSWWRPCV